jgi:hypothetical protein
LLLLLHGPRCWGCQPLPVSAWDGLNSGRPPPPPPTLPLSPLLALPCAVSFGIITTAAFTTVKHSWAKDLLGFNYLLYGRGYGCNIVSWIMGFFCMVMLFWPLVEEHPHFLTPFLPKVPPRPKKAAPAPSSPRTSPQDVTVA